MKIGGLQKLTLLDYPGKTACTVFLSGCNFRCPYCHNPGLVLTYSEATDQFSLKKREETWQESDVMILQDQKSSNQQESDISEEEFFAYLKKRTRILDGVCVTGGEPLLQKGILDFLEKIKTMGFCIKLDTNGTSPQLLREACERKLVDYVAMDIKHAPKRYGKAVGILNPPMDAVQESLSYLLSGSVDYELRTTLVKGIHEMEDIEEICHWITGTKHWYLQNFRDSGDLVAAGTKKMESFSEEELCIFEKLAQEKGIAVSIRNI